ncbi:MAG: GNAT family N-acetyltransferase [Rikenellaceae bacterium]|nr:GNAT family N-acetyltransferase [Rikenellaceae bacterium]
MNEKSSIDFHPVTVADKPLFEYYTFSSKEQNCDLNFANIFCWSDTYHTEIAEVDNSLVIRFDNGGAKCYMQPFCIGDKALIVERLRQDAFSQRVPLRLYGLSREWREFLEKTYPDEFAFDTPRALCDYIYRTEDLARLQGRKYQPKRNHINHFVTRNDWYAEPLSKANIKDCIALNKKWLQGREVGEMEQAEQRALHRAFDNFEALGLRGLVLYANGAPAAFSYGTPINNDTFCIHIEKYDAEVQGAATMINRLMAQSLEEEFEFVNREDDLGLEGLRFAKISYHPIALLEKTSALHLTAEQCEMRKMWHEIFGDEIHEIDSFLINHSDSIPLIHKENGEVVSMLYIVPLEVVCKKVAYIYAVATKPEYRGRGIASNLLTKALRVIRASGRFDTAALIPSSTESKRLYARLGFEDTQMPMEFPANDYLGTGSVPHDLAMTINF